MRTRIVNLLLAAALALAVSRFWGAPGGTPEPAPPPAESPAAATPTPGAGTAPESAGEGAAAVPRSEGYDVIVARDLFSAARGVVPPAPGPAAKPAPKPQPQPRLTLSGVVILDGEKTAFLQEGTQEAKPRRLREGESFAGGTVKSIRPDGITFLFGGGEIVIPLRTPKDTGPLPAVGGRAAEPVQQPGVFPRRPVTGRTGAEPPGQPALPRPARQVPPPGLVEEVPLEGEDEEILPDEYFEEEGMEEGLDEGEQLEFEEGLPGEEPELEE